jgi:hypothetical protein
MDDLELMELKDVFPDDEQPAYGGMPFIAMLAAAGDLIPPWWSQARDIELRRFWKNSDHLAGTVNTLRDMMVAMPVRVVARDQTIKSYVREARIYTDIVNHQTESRSNFISQGWPVGFGPFIEDFYTIDNGAFMIADGPGRGDEPLKGPPTRLIHLDGCQCWRTQNKEYPIVYTDIDGANYQLHKSRVISLVAQSTPINSMYGVGFCAVSRCINIAQNLTDIGRYKQEKMGSRPHRGILAIENNESGTKDAEVVSKALGAADEMMDNLNLTRYSRVPVVSIRGVIRLIDFASLPDGYDELESVQLGMAVLALAFGVDVRQLAFAIGVSGQTRADAEVQHLKMHGKSPGVVRAQVKQQLESKFLPPYLELIFDYQDDAQDEAAAKIRYTRAQRRELDLNTGVTDVRTEREIMMDEGEITEAQFIAMELADGRLPDGEDVMSLFQSPDYQDVLPALTATPEEIETAIQMMHAVLMSNARNNIKQQASFALAALEKLKGQQQIQPVQEMALNAEPETDSTVA